MENVSSLSFAFPFTNLILSVKHIDTQFHAITKSYFIGIACHSHTSHTLRDATLPISIEARPARRRRHATPPRSISPSHPSTGPMSHVPSLSRTATITTPQRLPRTPLCRSICERTTSLPQSGHHLSRRLSTAPVPPFVALSLPPCSHQNAFSIHTLHCDPHSPLCELVKAMMAH